MVLDRIRAFLRAIFSEILRAATIVAAMEASHRDKKGAFGLDMGDGKGSKEMIDAPMLKQVCSLTADYDQKNFIHDL